jgi:integrase
MDSHADPNPEPASCPDTSENDMHPQTWSLDPTRILTRRELATVLADAKKTSRFANSRRNLVIARLACCCGLRVSEIGGLELDDVVVDVRSTAGRPEPQMVPARQQSPEFNDRTLPEQGPQVIPLGPVLAPLWQKAPPATCP